MNNDPLGLNDAPTPEIIRQDRAAPLPDVCRLHRRVTSSDSADSLETRVVILAHMLFLAYSDIKDHLIQ
jgi:hypothetical protein